MLPAILLMLMRHYRNNHSQQFPLLKAKLFYAAKIILLMAVVFLLAMIAKSQEKHLAYTIKRKGSCVGSMIVKESRERGKIILKLQSSIKTSFIFTFSANGAEEAVYDDGLLVYSSVYQKLNGSEKINKQIRYAGEFYLIRDKGREEKLYNVKIHYNLLCIYSHEPGTATLIFSDKYQKFLSIQKIENHHYRIRFPDGSVNDYFFGNGICKKIEISHAMYSAVMELNQ